MKHVVNLDGPDKASTIEDYIAAGAGTPTITWYNYSILQVMKAEDKSADFHIEINNLVNDYMDILRDISEKVTMSKKEQKKYFYNPELLAYDLYGSTEFDFLIMSMNGIIDPKEFDIETIRLIKKSDLVTVLSDIYNAETRYINENRAKYNLDSLTD